MEEKSYAVIGFPIAHTMSPFIHRELFRLSGVRARYRSIEVPPERLRAFLPELRALDGFNITIPHKRKIIPLLDSLAGSAEMFGSVNTVQNSGGRLTGYTTDGAGFRRALKAAGGSAAGTVFLLGAGGAARTIAFEAAKQGGTVVVATREHSREAARALCRDVREKIPGAKMESCLFRELSGRCGLLVNATPAGMYPKTGECPVGADVLRNADFVFDAVYNPNETALVLLARQLGVRACGGMGMLVRQAAAAQEIWTGASFAEEDMARIETEASLRMRRHFGNVVLCGFMGSGKTTVGRLLAKSLHRKFIDLDDWIEEREGMSVSDLFAARGEAGFRAAEQSAVREISLRSGLVIAAGGGTLLDPRNAALMRAGGYVVLLDASLPCVQKRLANDRSRPLLQSGNRRETIRRLYAGRMEAYRRAADVSVCADGAPAAVAEAILADLLAQDSDPSAPMSAIFSMPGT